MEAPLLADRYTLGDLVGRGGMADVFRGHDRVLDRAVAVKVLRESTAEGSDRARFTSEARTLAQLSHSGLVTVLDAGVDIDRPFLVMELVDGDTLADRLRAGPLDLETAGSVGVQLAEALAYAHERGVVHRDVKPANVLLDPGGRVKLADFGIARLIGDTVRHTQTGHAIGTAAYLAPEQVQGGEVDGRSDVYSLGLVLLESLTGRREYPGGSVEAALARLSREPEVPADLPAEWRETLAAMTAVDRSARPSADQVVALLRGQLAAPAASPGPAPRAVMADTGSATRLMTEPVTRVAVVPPDAGTHQPRIDRWGGWLAGLPARAGRRWRRTEPHERGVVAALLALVAFLVVVALLDSGSADEPPRDETPVQLTGPLRGAVSTMLRALEVAQPVSGAGEESAPVEDEPTVEDDGADVQPGKGKGRDKNKDKGKGKNKG